jgi:hypothetical protein
VVIGLVWRLRRVKEGQKVMVVVEVAMSWSAIIAKPVLLENPTIGTDA